MLSLLLEAIAVYHWYNSILAVLGGEACPSMQRCVAVVKATIIGMGPSSGYLWTHLFQPMQLKNTYIPGFLVSRYYIIAMFRDTFMMMFLFRMVEA